MPGEISMLRMYNVALGYEEIISLYTASPDAMATMATYNWDFQVTILAVYLFSYHSEC